MNSNSSGLPAFILASASPARRKLLSSAGIAHSAIASHFDEDSISGLVPEEFVQTLAEKKAESVYDLGASAFRIEHRERSLLILGCDSVLVLDGEIHGKPRTREEAVARWKKMRGKKGRLLTGHALFHCVPSSKPPSPDSTHSTAYECRRIIRLRETLVSFARPTDPEIEAYVDSGEAMRCAGAFALEGQGGLFVEGIEGCHSNVIGLSLPLLREMMQELGISAVGYWSQP